MGEHFPYTDVWGCGRNNDHNGEGSYCARCRIEALAARLALIEGAAMEVVKDCEGDGIKWPSVRALAALLPPPSPSTEEAP